MTESRPLGRGEREAKEEGAQHSHARSNIVALLRAPSASSPPPALEAEFWAGRRELEEGGTI
jgi:hypothetical protein